MPTVIIIVSISLLHKKQMATTEQVEDLGQGHRRFGSLVPKLAIRTGAY